MPLPSVHLRRGRPPKDQAVTTRMTSVQKAEFRKQQNKLAATRYRQNQRARIEELEYLVKDLEHAMSAEMTMEIGSSRVADIASFCVSRCVSLRRYSGGHRNGLARVRRGLKLRKQQTELNRLRSFEPRSQAYDYSAVAESQFTPQQFYCQQAEGPASSSSSSTFSYVPMYEKENCAFLERPTSLSIDSHDGLSTSSSSAESPCQRMINYCFDGTDISYRLDSPATITEQLKLQDEATGLTPLVDAIAASDIFPYESSYCAAPLTANSIHNL